MGYTPDSTAQGLRNRSTKLLGLVISSSTDPSFARLLLALEERVYELGWDLVLMHTLNKVEREEACLRRLLARRVEGVFIVPVYRMDPVSRIYQELEERAIPTLLLGHPAPFCPRFPGVAVDDLGRGNAGWVRVFAHQTNCGDLSSSGCSAIGDVAGEVCTGVGRAECTVPPR
jgi:LacI family transcriptional regulator